MAKAARPGQAGTTKGKEKVEDAQVVTTMRLRTEEVDADGKPVVLERSIRLGSVPFRERAAVRKATGLSFEEFLGDEDGVHVGLDTLQVWWWLAKRAENPLCTLDQALAEWPENPDADTFDVVETDGQDGSPEA